MVKFNIILSILFISTFVITGCFPDPNLPDEEPFITVQPSDVAVNVGDDAVFSVVAESSDDLEYHWWVGSSRVLDVPGKIQGATTNELTILDAQLSDSGVSYVVEVYNPRIYDDEGSWENSVSVTLTVTGGNTPFCGNGDVETGEECDDGNADNGDGCSNNCNIESGYSCNGEPSVCTLVSNDCLRTFYFSNSQGRDSDNGLSDATPKKTMSALQEALYNTQPGDCYLLKRGDSWNEKLHGDMNLEISGVQGTESNPITIGAYDSGELPVIEFTQGRYGWRFTLGNSELKNEYLVFENIHFLSDSKDIPAYGIYSGSTNRYSGANNHIIFRTCKFEGLKRPLFLHASSHNFTVENSEIKNSGNGIYSSINDFVVKYNNFYNVSDNGFDHHVYLSQNKGAIIEHNTFEKGFSGIKVANGMQVVIRDNVLHDIDYSTITIGARDVGKGYFLKDAVIERNFLYDTPRGINVKWQTGNNLSNVTNLIIKNNVIKDTRLYGIIIQDTEFKKSAIYNNVIINSNYNAIRSTGSAHIEDSEIKNNIFYDDISTSRGQVELSSLNEFDIDYNLYYSTETDDSFEKMKQANKEQHGISANPLFVNAAINNFHLSSNSPAIDAGVNVGVTKDFDGNSRPKGNGYDTGPYEYSSNGGITPFGHAEIMPLGDSITVGVGDWQELHGYRRKLYQDLVAAGYDVDFIGNETTGNRTDFDRDHNGLGGWHLDHPYWNSEKFLDLHLNHILDMNPPDILLFMMGSNDIGRDSPQTVLMDLETNLAILDQWEEDNNKEIIIVLAQIPDQLRLQGENRSRVSDYNALLPALVNEKVCGGEKFVLVDMQSAINMDTDLHDTVHPNKQGFVKIADVWFEALDEILSGRISYDCE